MTGPELLAFGGALTALPRRRGHPPRWAKALALAAGWAALIALSWLVLR